MSRLRGAMIRTSSPHSQQAVTRPHQWLDKADLASVRHEFECFRCKQKVYVAFGSDELDDGHNLPPETGGNCRQWQED